MARVPYSPVPEVAMSTQATPNVNVPVNIEAFGGTVASAIRSVGDTVDKAGDEIYARAKAMAQLENESIVRNAEAEYIVQAGEQRNQFLSREGANATGENLRNHIEETRKLQRDFADRMPNPMARRLFERSTRLPMSQSIFQAARYSATQLKQQVDASDMAVLKANQMDTYNDPNEGNFERGMARIQEIADRREASQGWADPKQKETFIAEERTKLLEQRIKGLAARNPEAAQQLFEKYRPLILEKAIPSIEGAVKNNLYSRVSQDIANQVLKEVPDLGGGRIGRREAVEMGDRMVREKYPNDPQLWEMTRRAIMSKVSNNEQMVRNDVLNDRYTIDEAIYNRGGRAIPTSVEELVKLNPQLQPIINRLPPAELGRLSKNLASMQKNEFPETAQTIMKYNEMRGLADTNRQAFLDTRVMELPIPLKQRGQLLDLQRKLLIDPNIGASVAIKAYRDLFQSMGPALEAAGVTRTPANMDRHNQFLGALQDALVVWQEREKRLPKGKELDEMGRQIFREVGGSQTAPTMAGRAAQFFGDIWQPFGSSRPVAVHQVQPSEATWQKQRKWWADQGITNVTPAMENEFKREWRRKAFQRLFGGATTSEQP